MSGPLLSVAPIARQQLPAVLAIAAEAGLPAIDDETLRASSTRSIAVAQDPEGTNGYIDYTIVADECELHAIAVRAAKRRAYVGQQLLDYMLAAAKARGCRKVYLELRASNQAALALYRKFGFEEQGRRLGYYTHPKEDAVILLKTIV